MWYLMVSKKENPLFVLGYDTKINPEDHSLASQDLQLRDGFFYLTFTPMIDSYSIPSLNTVEISC